MYDIDALHTVVFAAVKFDVRMLISASQTGIVLPSIRKPAGLRRTETTSEASTINSANSFSVSLLIPSRTLAVECPHLTSRCITVQI